MCAAHLQVALYRSSSRYSGLPPSEMTILEMFPLNEAAFLLCPGFQDPLSLNVLISSALSTTLNASHLSKSNLCCFLYRSTWPIR